MATVLTYSKKYKIIIGSTCLLLALTVLAILFIAVQQLILKTTGNLIFICFLILYGTIMAAAPVFALLWILKCKVELYDDKIKIITLVKNQEINIKDIVSYWWTVPMRPILVQYLKNNKEHQFYINRRLDPNFKLLKLLKDNNIKFNKKAYAKNTFWLLIIGLCVAIYTVFSVYFSYPSLPPDELLLFVFLCSALMLNFYSYFANKRRLKIMNDNPEFNNSN